MFGDMRDPSHFSEHFMIEFWDEHLRQHERITKANLKIEQNVHDFHVMSDPPVVTHFQAERSTKHSIKS
ncbi:MAG: MFS transporter [Nitrospira sp.]|nr:MFS transporter [Nitrospira sp.]